MNVELIRDTHGRSKISTRTQHHVPNFMKIPPNSQLAEELDRVTQFHLNYSIQLCESVFKKLDWSGMGINGRFLNHLRFADDIVLMAPNLEQLEMMLLQLNAESQKVGLKMNLSKTKVMTNIEEQSEIEIGDKVIKVVESYIYLGHCIKLGLLNQTAEVKRRIGLGWAAFGKLKLIFKSKMNNSLKRKVF